MSTSVAAAMPFRFHVEGLVGILLVLEIDVGEGKMPQENRCKVVLMRTGRIILRVLVVALYIAIGFLVILPVIAYINYFGAAIVVDHKRWAEYGAYMSGAYGPIIGLLTLMVLYLQYTTQKSFQRFEKQRYRIDVFKTSALKAVSVLMNDLDSLEKVKYATTADGSLVANDSNIRNQIDRYFCGKEPDSHRLTAERLIELARRIKEQRSTIYLNWIQVTTQLAALKLLQHEEYQAAFSMLKLDVMTSLGPLTCRSLDGLIETYDDKNSSRLFFKNNEG